MKFIGNTEEYLQFKILTNENIFKETIECGLSILWFESGFNNLVIDGNEHVFTKNQIVFLTEFHKVEVINITKIRYLKFNRSFYCVLNHDAQVGCKGTLFFGASQLPIINIPSEEIDQFETLWKMFQIEMFSNDYLQLEMLQIMLKRYLILCARLFKSQENFPIEKVSLDIVREFNFLVEQNFRKKHTIAEYAKLLNKSPKTLSNIFSKISSKSPLQYIQDRKILEIKRLLRYSDLQIQEVAYEIGYRDLQTFSRFFKRHVGISPSKFKKFE